MTSQIFHLAALGLLLPSTQILADNCAGARTTTATTYRVSSQPTNVVTRTYIRTRPVYATLNMSPVTTYQSVLERPMVLTYSSVGALEARRQTNQSGTQADHDNLLGDGDAPSNCGGASANGLSSALEGLIAALEAARRIKELLEPDQPRQPINEEELLKRLEPKIKELVDKALDERGIARKPPSNDNPALLSTAGGESAVIKDLRDELAVAARERADIRKTLAGINETLKELKK